MAEIWPAIAAIATVGLVWFGARKDAREVKDELTRTIKEPMIASLKNLEASIENLRQDQRADTEKIEKRLHSVEDHLRAGAGGRNR